MRRFHPCVWDVGVEVRFISRVEGGSGFPVHKPPGDLHSFVALRLVNDYADIVSLGPFRIHSGLDLGRASRGMFLDPRYVITKAKPASLRTQPRRHPRINPITGPVSSVMARQERYVTA